MTPPLIAIVGRPNVGKSTLFNRLAGKWKSIVEDQPGITRDRLYAETTLHGHDVRLMDTGGLNLAPRTKMERKVSHQAEMGIQEADVILFLMDGREGVTPWDREWVEKLRSLNKPKLYAVNKIDDMALDDKIHDFHRLGIHPLISISAEKHRNFAKLTDAILEALGLTRPGSGGSRNAQTTGGRGMGDTDGSRNIEATGVPAGPPLHADGAILRIAIIGRPNVGKSTLLNTILHEDRSIVDDAPGTTRDPVHTLVNREGRAYLIVDTAGIRKRAKTPERIDKFSIVAALACIDSAHMVVILIDGGEGPTDQDAHVAGYAFERHKAIVIIVNKWDEGAKKFTRERFKEMLELKMNYLKFCPLLFISARTGKNVPRVFDAIEGLREQYDIKVKTSDLNRAFEHIVTHHPLPTHNGRDIKMFYATQGGTRPPTFLVFCTEPAHVHFSYKRYVINALRDAFNLPEVPVRLVFKKR